MKRYQPALLGGLLIGILSSVPIVSAGNLCCCLWVITGGLLTAYLQQQNTPEPLEAGEAALGGLLAGIIGAIISVIISAIVLRLVMPGIESNIQEQIRQGLESNPDLPPDVRDRIESILSVVAGRGMVFLQLAVVLPIYGIFGLLGGLLGMAFFKKKLPPAAPPAAMPPTIG